MLALAIVSDKTFERARSLELPVTAIDEVTYRLPSATREEREHIVTLDDGDFPQSFSCTCDAYAFRAPCWAVAAALLEHVRLAQCVAACQGVDRALVSEATGLVWHTVSQVLGERIFTVQVPEGFSKIFVVKYERAVAARRAA